ncbi:MAG: hypothetical protein HYS59_02320 [Candidatus Vogelbacteria bacterium]|nr:hypothetical protein [Candidatus Vogelbacteria bacterium]
MKIFFIDTETTGNTQNDRLCQLAVKERGVVKPIVSALYKPPVPISIDSMAVHHITERHVADRPQFMAASEYATIKEILEGDEGIVVAHNAPFDIGHLSREGIRPKRAICTMKVAQALDPEENIPSYRLQYLRYLLGIDIEASAHDALGDVLVLEELFERLLEKVKTTTAEEDAAIEQMLKMSSEPRLIHSFRFGKYNGRKIADIAREDRGYLEWLFREKSKQPEEEADWLYTLDRYLK